MSLPPSGKVCKQCGDGKALSEFYAEKRNSDGLQGTCRACVKDRARRWSEAHPEQSAATNNAWRHSHPEQMQSYRRAWAERHPDVVAASKERLRAWNRTYQRGWYAQNRATVIARAAAWVAANPARAQATYEANADSRRKMAKARYLANAEERRAAARSWQKANPEQRRYIQARRRARKVGAEGRHTRGDWDALCARYGHRCLSCKRDDVVLTEDHIVPLSKGGSDRIDNIQCLCTPCNSAKGARVIDYRPTGGGG